MPALGSFVQAGATILYSITPSSAENDNALTLSTVFTSVGSPSHSASATAAVLPADSS